MSKAKNAALQLIEVLEAALEEATTSFYAAEDALNKLYSLVQTANKEAAGAKK